MEDYRGTLYNIVTSIVGIQNDAKRIEELGGRVLTVYIDIDRRASVHVRDIREVAAAFDIELNQTEHDKTFNRLWFEVDGVEIFGLEVKE